MPNIHSQTYTLTTLSECIQRDLASWSGVSLTYVRLLSDGKAFIDSIADAMKREAPAALVFKGTHNDCLILGAKYPAKKPTGALSYCWIEDVAQGDAAAHAIITAMTAPFAPLETNAGEKSPLSILLVEDDPMTSKMVTQHLQKFGAVITTANARQATANNTVRGPDIIFLDIHYKDDIHDGFDVLTNILGANPQAFVVMVSGDRDAATILKALSLGAQGFIAKPFKAEDFSHYLAKLARSR